MHSFFYAMHLYTLAQTSIQFLRHPEALSEWHGEWLHSFLCNDNIFYFLFYSIVHMEHLWQASNRSTSKKVPRENILAHIKTAVATYWRLEGGVKQQECKVTILWILCHCRHLYFTWVFLQTFYVYSLHLNTYICTFYFLHWKKKMLISFVLKSVLKIWILLKEIHLSYIFILACCLKLSHLLCYCEVQQ